MGVFLRTVLVLLFLASATAFYAATELFHQREVLKHRALVLEQGMTDLDVIPVETNTGLLRIEAIDTTRYRVDMGVPQFEPDAIPLRMEQREHLYRIEDEGEERFREWESEALAKPAQ